MRLQLLVTALLIVLAGHAAASAGETTKTFPDYQCQYTLPGKDWTWANPKSDSVAVCVAHNGAGLKFMLAVAPVPAGTVVDAEFTDGFDGGMSSAGPIKKRGGRLTTFKGLSCYECEWLVRGTSSAAFRVVIANGFAYQVQLLGGADPVEKRADFEDIMNGFGFTSPPVAPVAPEPLDPVEKLSRRIGQVGVYCLFGALVLGLVVRGARKK